jgi:hypothetical protein
LGCDEPWVDVPFVVFFVFFGELAVTFGTDEIGADVLSVIFLMKSSDENCWVNKIICVFENEE